MKTQHTPVASRDELQMMIRRRILERTFGRVQGLHVETLDNRIVVNGSTPTYHLKQLVIEAIRESVCDSLIEGWPAIPVSLNIEVSTGSDQKMNGHHAGSDQKTNGHYAGSDQKMNGHHAEEQRPRHAPA